MRFRLIAGLTITALALVANTIWVDSRTRAAAARDGGEIIDNDVEPANVKVEGEGSPVLLIHGFGGAIDWWDEITPALALHHRVVRIDLIGHGGTVAPVAGYEIIRQAQLASAVLDKLGIDRVTVFAHSMGGEVATALAGMKPERIDRMALIDSPPIAGINTPALAKVFFIPVIGQFLSHFQIEAMLRKALAQEFAPNFDIPDRFISDLRQVPYNAFRSVSRAAVAYRTAKPTYERLAELIPVPPLLVIFGSFDAMVPPERAKLFERVPGATVVIIDGAGHSPMVESPVQTLKLLEDFLSERAAYRANPLVVPVGNQRVPEVSTAMWRTLKAGTSVGVVQKIEKDGKVIMSEREAQ